MAKGWSVGGFKHYCPAPACMYRPQTLSGATIEHPPPNGDGFSLAPPAENVFFLKNNIKKLLIFSIFYIKK